MRAPLGIGHWLLFVVVALSPSFHTHAAEFSTPVAITNATIIPQPGTVIENATVVMDKGRIVAVGADIDIPAKAQRVDGAGLWVYAGFIDGASHVGIADTPPTEEEMARLRDIEQEVAQGPRTSMQLANRDGVWPHRSVADVYDKDTEALENYRKQGFTTALVTPHPALLGGAGDMLQLSGQALRASTIQPGLTQIASFGKNPAYDPERVVTYPVSFMGATALIRQTFMDGEWYRARHRQYAQRPNEFKRVLNDPVLEAMGSLIDGRQMLLFAADLPDSIHHALDLAEEFDQRIAILGGKEAWKLAPRLADSKVPVVVSLDWDDEPKLTPKKKKEDEDAESKVRYTTATWTPQWEDEFLEPLAVRKQRVVEWQEQVRNLQTLIAAGVQVALTGRDLKKIDDLWKNIRTAIKEGLDADDALAALTTGPASVFGLDNQLGTIAPRKLANLTVMTAPLDDKDAEVRYVFIDGERFDFVVGEKKDDEDEDEDEGDENEAAAEPEDAHPWAWESDDDRKPPIQTGGNLLLKHANILTITNGTLKDTDILVSKGRIQAIGQDLKPEADTTEVNLGGYWVMPGIVDPHSHLAIRGGVNEWTQSITSEVRIADVVNHTQLAIQRALAGGVTTIHTMHGSANSMGGQNAVLKLRYNTSPREMMVTSGPRIVKFALGENVTRARREPRFPNTRMGVESVMRHGFTAALEYRRKQDEYNDKVGVGIAAEIPRPDLRLEALNDILRGDIWVHSHCYRADEILRLLNVAEDFGFRIATLQHVLEGYRVSPEMYNHGVGGSTFADWWSYKKESFDAIPYNAAMMLRAGIVASLNSDSADLVRHLNLEAGKTMRFGGLNADEALRLITLHPAMQIGLDERIGSIEVGKDGDFAVYNAHPLDTFARNVMTIIEGEIYFADRRLDVSNMPVGPASEFVPAPPAPLLNIERNVGHRYAIVGATVHPVSSALIENGTILVQDGKISGVGRNLTPPKNATIIYADGLHVYPGLINAVTQMGLSEISGIPQTVDSKELARFQPELRALSAVNPHSEHIGVSLCEGITTSGVFPSGGVLSGRAAVIQMSGWTMPEMLRRGEVGLVIDLPSLPAEIEEDDREKTLKEHRELVEEIEAYMRQARHYASISDPEQKSLRMEALRPYVRGEKRTFFRANSYKEILEALRFAQTFELKAAIIGGGEAWKCAARLAESDVPVVITSVFRQATSPYERYDAFYANAGKLEEAGVRFCIASDGTEYAKQLPVHAGMAVAHGLSEDGAVRSVTLSAAEILGVDSEIGSLEVGKIADIIITTGHPCQASTRTIGCFIQGRPVELTSIHERNYERFSNRPEPDLKPTGELRGPPPMRVR